MQVIAERPIVDSPFLGLPIGFDSLPITSLQIEWQVGRRDMSRKDFIDAGARLGKLIIRVDLDPLHTEKHDFFVIAEKCSVNHNGIMINAELTKLSTSEVIQLYQIGDDNRGIEHDLSEHSYEGDESDGVPYTAAWRIQLPRCLTVSKLIIEIPFRSGGWYGSQEPYMSFHFPKSSNDRFQKVRFVTDCGLHQTPEYYLYNASMSVSIQQRSLTILIRSQASNVRVEIESNQLPKILAYSSFAVAIVLLVVGRRIILRKKRLQHVPEYSL